MITYKNFMKKARMIDVLDEQLYESSRTFPDRKKEGYFPYIPYVYLSDLYMVFLEIWMRNLEYKQVDKEIRFLDVGCGTGRVVKLAEIFGFKSFGVECLENVAMIGRNAYGLSEERLIWADAFDLDEEFLSRFDAIYTYMPIADRELMGKLHMHLVSKSRKNDSSYGNTLFVEMLPRYYPVCNKVTTHRYFIGKC